MQVSCGLHPPRMGASNDSGIEFSKTSKAAARLFSRSCRGSVVLAIAVAADEVVRVSVTRVLLSKNPLEGERFRVVAPNEFKGKQE